ncbi:MAG TPA: RNA polymerase sigma factor [Longimicrobiaceae bacterium]|nr:RNA polymerase sigma factor [Longimicrobiaceae bacterium]
MEALHEATTVRHTGTASPIREAQAGDVDAFERLYRENVEHIYALCLRLSADAVRADELTQDVFVHAWTKLGSFRGDSAFSTWLHRLAVNVVLGGKRSDKRRAARVQITGDLSIFDAGVAPPRVGDRMDLEDAVARLPDAARTIFVMHEIEGYTHDEIARLTGRAEGTCKTLLHRARKLLRESLAR